MNKKPMDIAIEDVGQQILHKEAQQKKMRPLLDAQLNKVQKIDNFIIWHEEKIKGFEKEKQNELLNMSELLDTAMQATHSLSNGYIVKPDNKRKIEIEDIAKFMKWLKQNKPPLEVFQFFEGALKVSNLKKFCEKEFEVQRLNGEILPTIDGIEFGDITYRRLTTEIKKGKK